MFAVGIIVAVVSAAAAGWIAGRKGYPVWLWGILGLLMPVAAPLIALTLYDLNGLRDLPPDRAVAVRASVLARTLARSPEMSAHELAKVTGHDDREVTQQLSALETLGVAQRDRGGRWRLTPEAGRCSRPPAPSDLG